MLSGCQSNVFFLFFLCLTPVDLRAVAFLPEPGTYHFLVFQCMKVLLDLGFIPREKLTFSSVWSSSVWRNLGASSCVVGSLTYSVLSLSSRQNAMSSLMISATLIWGALSATIDVLSPSVVVSFTSPNSKTHWKYYYACVEVNTQKMR